ncbi:MAG: transcription repressor NadR [Clostridia bacterium]|nr:transcription repressor NadR [Clostridia bacterium]MBO5439981.1 transcription repressor NadR [Clostridia bacterium]
MNAKERRENIIKCLEVEKSPISATALAKIMGVSRQVIVNDVALLRAEGKDILSLARGYQLQKKTVCQRALKLIHTDDEVETELNLVVDLGGTVVDVFVYHRSYGLLRAKMDIKSRLDVQNFLNDIKTGKSSLLKNVTSGYHYHTIRAESEKALDLIEKALKDNGFLAQLQEHEPNEIKRTN